MKLKEFAAMELRHSGSRRTFENNKIAQATELSMTSFRFEYS